MPIISRAEIDEINRSVNLESLITQLIGAPKGHEKRGDVLTWCCPFHSERTPSFKLDTTTMHWHCFGACSTGGDAIEFVRRWHGDTFMEAIERITGKDFKTHIQQNKLPPRPKEGKRKIPPLTEEIVRNYHREWKSTYGYFHDRRAITVASIRDFVLGTQLNSVNVYEFRDKTVERIYHRRFVIPWQFGGKFYQLSKRRDDDYARMVIRTRPELVDRIKRNYNPSNPNDITEDELIDIMFGPKYKRYDGSIGSIFNLDQLIATDFLTGKMLRDSKNMPIPNRIEQVLINEAPISAISEADLGYSAVAVNYNSRVNYRTAFSGVIQPVLLADNDGGTGLTKAKTLLDLIENPLARILITPDPWKDPNDVIAYDKLHGTTHFRTWMKKNNIAPLFNQKE